jgi:hypothetical protein
VFSICYAFEFWFDFIGELMRAVKVPLIHQQMQGNFNNLIKRR